MGWITPTICSWDEKLISSNKIIEKWTCSFTKCKEKYLKWIDYLETCSSRFSHIAILTNRNSDTIPSTTMIGSSACSCRRLQYHNSPWYIELLNKKNLMNHKIKSNKKTKTKATKSKNKIKLTREKKTYLCKCLFEFLQHFTKKHQQHFTKINHLTKIPMNRKKNWYLLWHSLYQQQLQKFKIKRKRRSIWSITKKKSNFFNPLLQTILNPYLSKSCFSETQT